MSRLFPRACGADIPVSLRAKPGPSQAQELGSENPYLTASLMNVKAKQRRLVMGDGRLALALVSSAFSLWAPDTHRLTQASLCPQAVEAEAESSSEAHHGVLQT